MDDYNKLQPVCGLNLGLHIKKKNNKDAGLRHKDV